MSHEHQRKTVDDGTMLLKQTNGLIKRFQILRQLWTCSILIIFQSKNKIDSNSCTYHPMYHGSSSPATLASDMLKNSPKLLSSVRYGKNWQSCLTFSRAYVF